jgi:hypothetical protein
MRRWWRAAIIIAGVATGCEAGNAEPAAEPSAEGGVCELGERDVVMHVGGDEHLGIEPPACIENFRVRCMRCSQGTWNGPRYAKIRRGDAISFSMDGGAFVRREPCTRGECTTTLVTYQLDSNTSVTTKIEEGVPVSLDLAPGTYFADLNVIYESEDGDYYGSFPASFGLIVKPAE